MTVKATITCAFPEARRIAAFLERDYQEDGAVVSLVEISEKDWVFAIEAYFEGEDAAGIREMLLDGMGTDMFRAPLDVEVLEEKDWIAEGLQHLTPVSAGRFVVHGSHDRAHVGAGRTAIEIDAGRAFGTGHHGTTAGCLEMIDKVLRRRPVGNALDLGTGSGVLAIALAKMLRRPVTASDIDPVSIEVASENARLNAVAPLVRFHAAAGVETPGIRRDAPYDLIVANILAEPLMRLAPSISKVLAPGGTLILSGLLPNQRERVVAAYRGQNLRLEEARIVSGWAVLRMHRP